ncbi:RNA methyltransferase [Lithospermum erythrorhizon]|uniref:tRNA (guanine(26)-N(2))-dimethyltransferase n=1 Tax=Lithospermum erythrorhizon TaxID=34254 RepID=A0AAV3P4X3_LITER
MLSISLKPLSSSSFLRPLIPIPIPIPIPIASILCKSQLHVERGIEFDVGDTFFRHESAIGRDLGVLSAALHKKANGTLRLIDAMCGCGVRSIRYLAEAEVDFVIANDANQEYRGLISENLSRVVKGFEEEVKRWEVRHLDANRLMMECYLNKDFYDFIDVDSFGSDSMFLRAAIGAVKLGGLLYLTSTDGYTSGGHRPQHSLAAYGAYIRPMPFCNELGLRMLIGGALREASTLGYHVAPLFSYYSYHGPVFRTLLQVKRGKLPDNRHYSFISYCKQCGSSQAFSWGQLGKIRCPCSENVGGSCVVSGPLWTGPLHNAPYLRDMQNLASQWEWISDGVGKDLEKLLEQMVDESDPKLPPGYFKLDEIASRAKVNSPSLANIMNILHKKGYAASRSHIESNAIKTNCTMTECVSIVRELQQSLIMQQSRATL